MHGLQLWARSADPDRVAMSSSPIPTAAPTPSSPSTRPVTFEVELVADGSTGPASAAHRRCRARLEVGDHGVRIRRGRLHRVTLWRRRKADIVGWHADGIGRAADGTLRQVLEVRALAGGCRVLADAADVGALFAALQAPASASATDTARVTTGTTTGAAAAPATATDAPSGAATAVRRWRRFAAGSPRRWLLRLSCLAAVGLAASGAPALLASGAARPADHPLTADLVRAFGSAATVDLPVATAPPAPAPPQLAVAPPLAAHEVFGFAPYWELVDPAAMDLASLTTIAYFSVDIAGDGRPVTSGPGWDGYRSQALADLVTEAHAHGQRVVLTATCFDQSALDQLTQSPAAQTTLAASLVTLVRAKNLDGVNLDFEGTGSADRAGLDQLVRTVGTTLHATDPHWQFTVDTYGSSATDPAGFFDITGMAAWVDAFVVMAYDMGSTTTPGPTAPLTGPGETDTAVAASYAAAVGGAKVILGLPLYGYDWPTTGPAAGAPATGPPVAVADDQVSPSDTVYWDPTTGTPWAVYDVGGQWHQVWFDDAVSLAAKAALVGTDGLRGTALWALGMAAGLPADQVAAATATTGEPTPPDGPVTSAPPTPSTPGPGATSATPAPLATPPSLPVPVASADLDGVPVTLSPLAGAVGATTALGTSLTGVVPASSTASCPVDAGPLPIAVEAGTDIGVVVLPASGTCPGGPWTFTLPSGSSPSGTTTTVAAGQTTGSSGASAGSGNPGASAGSGNRGEPAGSGTGSGNGGGGSSSSSSDAGSAPSGAATGSSWLDPTDTASAPTNGTGTASSGSTSPGAASGTTPSGPAASGTTPSGTTASDATGSDSSGASGTAASDTGASSTGASASAQEPAAPSRSAATRTRTIVWLPGG